MKPRFWSNDWLAGLNIANLVAGFSGLASIQSLDGTAHSWGMRSCCGIPLDRFAVIAIDDRTIANLIYDLDTDSVKIAEFDIARITDSSKSKS